ncbi:MAG: hypothetical protein EOP34_01380 [Rickettsiales bacterium]|nr:MAG: hypothetical protein EOP34_01380 [Rickettsiales bacterium]
MNKIGDVSLTIGMVLLLIQLSSTELSLTNSFYKYYLNDNSNLAQFLFICFIIAAAAKSAQILLHTWLSDAMQGEILTVIYVFLLLSLFIFLRLFCKF